MQKVIFIFSLALFLVSCGKSNRFTIEGNIKNASGSMLYLEHVGISKASITDSVLLNADGDFKFRKERSAFPEFYRLKLGRQFIDLAIDSTETIIVKADSAVFTKEYTIDGSENNMKIKELSLLRADAANTFNKLDKSFRDKKITPAEYEEQAYKAINTYKEEARNYIMESPASTVAYYALLQTINGLVIFDPYDKADNRIYGAVATQWDFCYPGSPLSMHLKNLGLAGMKALRAERNPSEYPVVKATDIFDIDLPTVSGPKLRLSEVIQGKVTLLEFTTYFTQGSPLHNMLLAEIYEKYKDKGFQIYQVSLDEDEHAWKNAAVNLPWMCVRDPQSAYSEIAKQYNIDTLPSGFIIDREGEVVMRVIDYESLKSDVAKYLK